MFDNGFVLLHRSMNDWGWKKDPKTLALWVHLLLNANWRDGHYMGHKIRAGDIVVGRKSLSSETGLSEREIRTCIDKLKMTGEVTSKTTNRFTILTIVKWEQYQAEREQATSVASNKRPTSDQQATTTEQSNKVIKDITNVISSKEKDSKKGTRLSENWTLPVEWGLWALNFGLTRDAVLIEEEKFRDYWISLAGAKATKRDWQAAWRNWIRNKLERGY